MQGLQATVSARGTAPRQPFQLPTVSPPTTSDTARSPRVPGDAATER